MSADGNTPILTPELSKELIELNGHVKNAMVAFGEVKAENAATKQNLVAFFDTYEKHASAYAKAFALYEKAIDEQKSAIAAAEKAATEAGKLSEEQRKRVDDMVLKIATKGVGASGDERERKRDNAEYKNFMGWLAYHPSKRDSIDLDVKTLRTDSDVQGAYLIPQVMDHEIRKNITEISPVRLHARTRTSPSKSMDIPRRLALLQAYYEGEGETGEVGQSTYGSEQITLYRQTVTVPATLDMMISSAFDLEREIAADVGESFGKGEGYAFVQGSGVKGPQGFVKDSRCEIVPTAGSGEITFNDMSNIMGKLKRGQMPWWYFNRRTLAYIQGIKSTIGVPIWQPVSGSTPATIWGFPYSSDMIDLDDAQTGSNAKPIVFGDLRRGYEIFDMVGISVIRDDLSRKKDAITEWTFRRYNTGRVIIPEAIKVLKVL